MKIWNLLEIVDKIFIAKSAIKQRLSGFIYCRIFLKVLLAK